jgi:hypothetical protein
MIQGARKPDDRLEPDAARSDLPPSSGRPARVGWSMRPGDSPARPGQTRRHGSPRSHRPAEESIADPKLASGQPRFSILPREPAGALPQSPTRTAPDRTTPLSCGFQGGRRSPSLAPEGVACLRWRACLRKAMRACVRRWRARSRICDRRSRRAARVLDQARQRCHLAPPDRAKDVLGGRRRKFRLSGLVCAPGRRARPAPGREVSGALRSPSTQAAIRRATAPGLRAAAHSDRCAGRRSGSRAVQPYRSARPARRRRSP